MSDKARVHFENQKREFQFSQYASHGLWTFPLVFLALGIIDYFQVPELSSKRLAIRAIPLGYFWLSYLVMWKFALVQKFVDIATSLGVATAVICTHYFMWTNQSQIPYSWPILIVGVLAAAHVFRIDRKQMSWLASLAFLPTIALILHSTYATDLRGGIIDSVFLFAALLVAFTKNHDKRNALRFWAKATAVADEEISKAKRADLLKRQFPTHLQQEIENNKFDLKERELSPAAVIGFADFTHVSSDFDSPTTGLFADWELKERFTEIAVGRATSAGFVVLSCGPEGLCFVANFRTRGDWQNEMMVFFEGLCSEFNDVVTSLREHIGHFECGIRIGVSMGPMVLGWTRTTPPQFEAIGSEIAMATKLCRGSRMNSMTFTSSVWNLFRGITTKWETLQRSHGEDLRGLEHELPIAEIRSSLVVNGNRMTCECGLPLGVVKSDNGLINVDCAQAHRAHESTVTYLRKSS